jgi:predicted nucleic acid-binding protein
MAVLYADSSALAKRYLAEVGTVWVQALLDPASGNEVYVARISHTELIAAITRRERGRTISATDATIARADFRADFAARYHPVEVTEVRVEEASLLAEKHGLRGYDAVQLACAMAIDAMYRMGGLPPITLISADAELNAAAAAEGLATEDPNVHP